MRDLLVIVPSRNRPARWPGVLVTLAAQGRLRIAPKDKTTEGE